MSPKKRRRLYFAAAILLAAGGATWLILGALKDNVIFFRSPSDVAQLQVKPGVTFRIGGLVEEHSVTHGSGAEVDEKYMPPEVVDALKKSGEWQKGGGQ